MVKLVVGIDNVSFDSAHYTRGVSEKCLSLHGHTYRLSVEVEGEVDERTGMVIDFGELRRVVLEVVEEYDHKVVVSRRDLKEVKLEGPFRAEIKVIDYPHATTEYLALDIAKKIYSKLRLPVRVKLFEGRDSYVVVEVK